MNTFLCRVCCCCLPQAYASGNISPQLSSTHDPAVSFGVRPTRRHIGGVASGPPVDSGGVYGKQEVEWSSVNAFAHGPIDVQNPLLVKGFGGVQLYSRT